MLALDVEDVLERRIPGSARRSCTRSCGRSRTPGRAPPSTRQPVDELQTEAFSSITEHSLHGIRHLLPKRRESVTYVSGTICHLSVGSLTANSKTFSIISI